MFTPEYIQPSNFLSTQLLKKIAHDNIECQLPSNVTIILEGKSEKD